MAVYCHVDSWLPICLTTCLIVWLKNNSKELVMWTSISAYFPCGGSGKYFHVFSPSAKHLLHFACLFHGAGCRQA